MLPTFVIGLREGLEAALIVGIIATFLQRRSRPDLLRSLWIGVSTAVLICLGIGITLYVVSREIKQQQQERLETVVGALAVLMVTYMIIWMRRHAREMKGDLEGAAEAALAKGSGSALVLMAFLAVMREGFETAVFLLATFQTSHSTGYGVAGAALGILLAAAIGYGIYRGGIRLNLTRFFTITGVVLVLVAAGLVVTAFHTAFEAGWLLSGHSEAFDLSWLVRPGTPLESLFTGVLGVQPRPTVIETVGWLVYVVPMLLFVCWPRRRAAAPRARAVSTSSAH
ncbi:MAG TPA: iron uptake transporter permease EfeU [Mycobacteriales bacterium]|nr:iron uptake transporter permease EfeU [Mycobacteriales bacterium]